MLSPDSMFEADSKNPKTNGESSRSMYTSDGPNVLLDKDCRLFCNFILLSNIELFCNMGYAYIMSYLGGRGSAMNTVTFEPHPCKI